MSDFWSRRRAAVKAEAQAEQTALLSETQAQTEAELEARSDEDLLTELNLQAPETLDNPEAIRDFLQHALPQRLKTRALRRLWRLNPVLANLDGLVDYGEDFTDSATVVENLQTAYQVGKGMLAHIEEMARKAEAAKAAAETEAGTPEPDEGAETLAQDIPPEPILYDPPDYGEAKEDAPAFTRPPARMQFQFKA